MSTEQNSPFINIEKLMEDFSGEIGGVAGYRVPKNHTNCAKQRKDRDHFEFMEKVWKGKKAYPRPKENFDKDGKVILPKRPNYFNELFRSVDFGYSKEKENALKEIYERKNRPMSIDPNKLKIIKEKDKAKIYRHDRITYFEGLTLDIKKSKVIYPHMEKIIEKAKENMKKNPKKPSESETTKESYKKRGSLPYRFILFF